MYMYISDKSDFSVFSPHIYFFINKIEPKSESNKTGQPCHSKAIHLTRHTHKTLQVTLIFKKIFSELGCNDQFIIPWKISSNASSAASYC